MAALCCHFISYASAFTTMTIKTFFVLPLLVMSHVIAAQILADFETAASTPALSPAGAVVTDNPDPLGNSSNKIAYYQKPAGNWHAIYLNFASDKNIGENDRLTFKLRSSTKGRVFVKVVNNGTTIHEAWAPEYAFMPEAGKWTECTLDVSSIQNQEFNRIEVNASVDNESPADVYVDDFKLVNSLSPNGEPIASVVLSPPAVTLGESIQFDASGSIDPDGTIVSYTWNFGDGATATENIVNHAYTTDGIFKVSLVVEDNNGNKSYWNSTVNIFPAVEKISNIRFTSPDPRVHEKVEGIFLVKGNYANVYDPDVVKADAIITRPDLSTIAIPCFFFQKATYSPTGDQWKKAAGDGYWMFRFSSSQTGVHQVQLQVTDAEGTVTGSLRSVTIEAGDKKGYVKTDSENKQFYRHTSGEPFYPLGINVAWNTTTNYTTIINNLGAGKANLVRYWQVPFDRQGLEWKNGSGFYKGLGVYSQEAAAEQDSIFRLCEANDLYLQMTIFQHGMFSETVNSNWPDNPYNSANGGPLTRAEQYFYNADAKTRTKKLLRYIVARWGYSTNLFAWELFNEVNFTGGHPNQTTQWLPGVMTWHDEMGQYIKSQDPFDHPITTSSDESHLDEMDKLNGLDIVQYHLYNTSLLTTQISKDKSLLNTMTRTGVINGEYGLDVNTADVPFDVQRVSIWTGIMTQVPHLMWKWESYTDAAWANLFKVPAAYIADEDFVSEGTLADWTFDVNYGPSKLSSAGFRAGQNFYAIIYDPANRNTLVDVTCNFSTLPSGNYTITYYDVLTGAMTTTDADISSRTKIFTLPTFSKVIAIKVKFNYAIVSGTEDLEFPAVTLYPNPAHEFVELNVSKVHAQEMFVQVYDVMGKEVMVTQRHNRNQEGSIRIELTQQHLPSGVYSVKVSTGKEYFTRRFIYLR